MLLIHDVCTFIQIYFYPYLSYIYILLHVMYVFIYIYIYIFLTTCTSIVHHVCICMFFFNKYVFIILWALA